VKSRIERTVDSPADEFEETLNGRHVYNIRYQYNQLRQERFTLTENEAMIPTDFSKNYGAKYNREIQSVHFGASNAQATSHTGIVYVQNNKYGFASISECKRYDASPSPFVKGSAWDQ